MWQAVSTEARGWLEALSDRPTVARILVRVLCTALCAAVLLLVAGALDGPWLVLGASLGALGYSLARLRVTGTP